MSRIARILSAIAMSAAVAGAQTASMYEPVKWHPFNNSKEFTGPSLALIKGSQTGALLTRSQSRGGGGWTLQPVQQGTNGWTHLGTPTVFSPNVRIFTAPSLTYPNHFTVYAYDAVSIMRDPATTAPTGRATAAPPVVEAAIPVQQLDAVMFAFSFRSPPKSTLAQIVGAVASMYSDGLKYGVINENNVVWLNNNNRVMRVADQIFLTDGAIKLKTWPSSDFMMLRADGQVAVIRFLGLTK